MPSQITKDILWKGILEDCFEGFFRYFYPKQADPMGINERIMEALREQAIEEGLKEGMEKGMEEAFKRNITRLLLKGYSPEQVTGLLDVKPEMVAEVLEKLDGHNVQNS